MAHRDGLINGLNMSAPTPFGARRSVLGVLRATGKRALAHVLPPRCLGCGGIVVDDAALCASCWGAIRFLGPPCCDACGRPFDYAVDAETLCAACLDRRPVYARARAAFVYDDASRDLVLALKHGDRCEGVGAFARWMVRAGRDILCDADVIVPVPLHWTRVLRRRYNQSALLARAVLGQWHGAHPQDPALRYLPEALSRTRRTPPQGGLDRSGRAHNVRGAFAVAPPLRRHIAAKRVVLIDDVMTTGATLNACARALLAAGAARVDALTLARAQASRE